MVKVFKSQKGMEHVLRSYDELLKLWAIEYTERDVPTTFGTTHCIIAGKPENPPLILFHGVGDNSAVMWAPNIKKLSEHFYCIAVDTLGGPGKSVPNERYDKKSFCQQQWINELTEQLQLKCFNMAGVSNGAAMVFNYTTKESERVHKAVCVEGGIVTDTLKSTLSTIGMMFPECLIPTKRNMIKILQKLCAPDSGFTERYPELADHLILLMKCHNQRAMFVHTLEQYSSDNGLPIKDKLYFLLGSHMVKKRAAIIDVLNKGAYNYTIVQGAGHALNHEQAETANEEIICFILNEKAVEL